MKISPITNSMPLLCFCGQKDLMQIRLTLRRLRCIQYMATSVLRSQQYTSGVRKC